MKKISALAAFTMAALVLATPAHADDGNRGRIVIAGYRDFSTANICRQAVGLVPMVTPWTGAALNDACNNRDHSDDSDDTRG
ncbi:hypothetical protein [Streptomyces viridochromogenes]|uniref:Secreted protein n=1 Tax=Streptomyces viridochromogenes Tue57 TaxID=1160705 RepID=L8PDH3_STRVR|nr:hypothetical protein [Streptomyces viridochromogenes]ELS53392.1 hypothetical protein STVIR_5596 [Streptomyces viridochromogenes Tue57]